MRMTKTICICFFISMNFSIYSQSKYSLKLKIHEQTNWQVIFDTIPASQFDNSKQSELSYGTAIEQHDSILKSITREFPKTIMQKDSCLVLRGVDRDLKLCKTKPFEVRKSTDYRLFNIKDQFLIFEQVGYESQRFVTFNPTTQEYFITAHLPIFINKNLVYSFGNYYTEGQFQIINNKNNKYFGFETFNWKLTRFYKSDNTFIIELISNHSAKEKKYLRIEYN